MSPRRNFTVEDTSPLIQYTPRQNWNPCTSNDPTVGYSMGTYQASINDSSTATLSFNGTGVWIYGAQHSDLGWYTATIDGGNSLQLDGSSNDALQPLLYNATDLEQGYHTVIITNDAPENNTYLIIAYIVYESEVADNSTVVFDGTEPNIYWNPPGVWEIDGCISGYNTPVNTTYQGSSCHISSNSSANVALSFLGDSITVYGGVGPQYGQYNVSLDNQFVGQFTAKNSGINAAPVILYSATSLGHSTHTVTLTLIDQDLELGIAYFVAGSAASGSTETVKRGPIVGAVVGTLAFCCGVFALLWFFVLRHCQFKRRASWDTDAARERHAERGITPFMPNMYTGRTSGSAGDFDPYTMHMSQIIPANAVGRPITGFSAPMTLPEQPDSPPAELRDSSVARDAHQSQTSLSYTFAGPTEGLSRIPTIMPAWVAEGENKRFSQLTVQNNFDAGTSLQRLTSPGAESSFSDAPPSYVSP